MTAPHPAVIFLGSAVATGSYLLRINLSAPITVKFGQFKQGQPISFSRGSYLYVGSAMGSKGASSLAYRLRRHTLRTDPKNAHPIHPMLIEQAQQTGLKMPPPSAKKSKTCFWHVDYLLDHPQANLPQIIAIRSPQRLESALANWLAQMPETSIIVPGLGASDATSQTHLLQVNANPLWWANLPARCLTFIPENLQ